jgi:hypothetical protein
VLPFYYGYRFGGKTLYEFFPAEGVRAGYFVMSGDYSEGDYYPCAKMGARTTLMQINTSLMIQFTFATAALSTILLHASVTRLEGKAQLFFGVSGTGKSTHSRLWHEYVPESDLMNDDNPVIRIVDGIATLFGSPWSGKTPCYRNIQAPIGAITQLKQAPHNTIRKETVVEAFASILPSCSIMKWDKRIYSGICDTVKTIIETVPTYYLENLPNEDAVKLSFNTIRVKESLSSNIL